MSSGKYRLFSVGAALFCKKLFYTFHGAHPVVVVLRMTLKTYLREKRSTTGLRDFTAAREDPLRLPCKTVIRRDKLKVARLSNRDVGLTVSAGLSVQHSRFITLLNDSFRFRRIRDSRKINDRRPRNARPRALETINNGEIFSWL